MMIQPVDQVSKQSNQVSHNDREWLPVYKIKAPKHKQQSVYLAVNQL